MIEDSPYAHIREIAESQEDVLPRTEVKELPLLQRRMTNRHCLRRESRRKMTR